MDDPKVITINADGTYSPASGVVINPGGVVKFEVSYPQGTNTATIQFVTPIPFSEQADPDDTGGNTIKVG